MQNQKTQSKEITDMMVEDKAFRIVIARDSFYWFFRYYFRHYTTSPTGAFQKQIFEDLQDWEKAFIEIIAFRGSAKSTMASLALPIWAVISNRAKFPIIAGDTGIQAKLHL